MSRLQRPPRALRLAPPTLLALSFLFLIALGTLLLKLPIASQKPITWLQALFVATSSVTVTGLTTVDIGSTFSRVGQTIIALLIQCGGLGFMTIAVLIIMRPTNRHIALSQQLAAREALGQTSLSRLGQTARAVVGLALSIELIGFLVLGVYWHGEMGWERALFEGFFHTISAFNNVGFALYPDGVTRYVGDIIVNLVLSALLICGGLGFLVMMDLKQQRFRWSRLQTNTRIMLLATLFINLIAFILFFTLEYHNTLKDLPTQAKVLGAWLQAISPRTAGFNSVSLAQLHPETAVMSMALMFIGGGSMSTAGGIKVGTFVVLIAATWAFLRQRDQVVLLQRNVPQAQVMKAMAVTLLTAMMAVLGCFLLAHFERKIAYLDLMYEVMSALNTVGLTRDVTMQLSTPSQWVIIVLMFCGRVGALTLGYFIASPKPSRIRYPDTQIGIG